MFQFPTFAPFTWCQAFYLTGCPIRISGDQRLFAPPPSLSQLITSFIASESLGIHRLPFLTFLPTTLIFHYWLKMRRVDIFLSLLYFFTLLICQHVKDLFPTSGRLECLPSLRFLWRITDSNRWPSACKADALASWANPPWSLFPCRIQLPFYRVLFLVS